LTPFGADATLFLPRNPLYFTEKAGHN